ncbi:hypothetical protein VE03_04382 [Pseudogymnoascus sp. 23342-1-I1]|nr:hypothetical protein VE03_04382 [Pseudogymnoascus sp. 23342-1-I1]
MTISPFSLPLTSKQSAYHALTHPAHVPPNIRLWRRKAHINATQTTRSRHRTPAPLAIGGFSKEPVL